MGSPEAGRKRPWEAGHQEAGHGSGSGLSSPDDPASPDLQMEGGGQAPPPPIIIPAEPVEPFMTPAGKTPDRGDPPGVGWAAVLAGLAAAGTSSAREEAPARRAASAAKRARILSPPPREGNRRDMSLLLSEIRGGGERPEADPPVAGTESGGARRRLSYADMISKNPHRQEVGGQGRGAREKGGAPPGGGGPPGKAPPGRRPRAKVPSSPFLPSDHPVIIEEVGGGFSSLSPWERERLLKKAVPGFKGTLRRLPSGGWLVSCQDQEVQGRVFRLTKLGPGVEISTKRPRPVVVGVIRGLPVGKGLEEQVKEDLITQGLSVDSVSRLDMADGWPSRSLRVAFFEQRLPERVRLGSEDFPVAPYVPVVRRCTKCQTFGHTRHNCRRKLARCARCGRDGHEGAQCRSDDLCCVNCGGAHSAAWQGCPEAVLRKKAGEIRSARYMPFMHALKLAREEMGDRPRPPPKQTKQNNKTAEVEPRPKQDRAPQRKEMRGGGNAPPLERPQPQVQRAPWRFGEGLALFASTTEGEAEASGSEEAEEWQVQESKNKKKKRRKRKNKNKDKNRSEEEKEQNGGESGTKSVKEQRRPKAAQTQEGGKGTGKIVGREGDRGLGTGNNAPRAASPLFGPVRDVLDDLANSLAASSPEIAPLFKGIITLLEAIERIASGRDGQAAK